MVSIGSRLLFEEDPTPPIPGLEQLDNEAEREVIRRWIRDEGLGSCSVVSHDQLLLTPVLCVLQCFWVLHAVVLV